MMLGRWADGLISEAVEKSCFIEWDSLNNPPISFLKSGGFLCVESLPAKYIVLSALALYF